MEYSQLKKSFFISLFLALIGCNTMDIDNNKDEALLRLFTMPSIEYLTPNDFFGYKDQQSYYTLLSNRDTDRHESFTGIGKFFSNDPKVKLKIKLVEREIQSNQDKSAPPSQMSIHLTKANKVYSVQFDGNGQQHDDLVYRLIKNTDEIRETIYKSNIKCEYCFEPTIELTSKGQDYIFNLKLKNIGTNDFELEGISSLKKVEIFKSDSMLSLKINNNIINLDKDNLLDNKYLGKIKIINNGEVTIPFVIHQRQVPEPLKNKNLTQLKVSAFWLSQYASGELKGSYFDIAVSSKNPN